jgi:hypothetical protein
MPDIPALTRLTNDMLGDDSSDDIAKHWERLIGLYVLTCYLFDPTTRNMTIDQIRRFYYEIVRYDYSLEKEVIKLVLRSTPDCDALRNLFADFFVFENEDSYDDLPGEWSLLLYRRSRLLRDDQRLVLGRMHLDSFQDVPGPEGWDDYEYYDWMN